jgi:hypothetical protein
MRFCQRKSHKEVEWDGSIRKLKPGLKRREHHSQRVEQEKPQSKIMAKALTTGVPQKPKK